MTATISTLMSLCITLGVYLFAEQIYIRLRRNALVHPVLMTTLVVIGLLKLSGWEYQQYQKDTYLISFLLGPATVALAVPLYENMELIKRMAKPLIVATLTGSFTASASAYLMTYWWTGDQILSHSMLVKSITTPIAISLAEKVGGDTSLAAGMVLLTGAIGCIVIPSFLNLLKVDKDIQRGYAMGVTAHGFGTAQAFERSVTCGAFAGLAMSLTGVTTAIMVPLLLPVIRWLPFFS